MLMPATKVTLKLTRRHRRLEVNFNRHCIGCLRSLQDHYHLPLQMVARSEKATRPLGSIGMLPPPYILAYIIPFSHEKCQGKSTWKPSKYKGLSQFFHFNLMSLLKAVNPTFGPFYKRREWMIFRENVKNPTTMWGSYITLYIHGEAKNFQFIQLRR